LSGLSSAACGLCRAFREPKLRDVSMSLSPSSWTLRSRDVLLFCVAFRQAFHSASKMQLSLQI
jgi:hypothetical protein